MVSRITTLLQAEFPTRTSPSANVEICVAHDQQVDAAGTPCTTATAALHLLNLIASPVDLAQKGEVRRPHKAKVSRWTKPAAFRDDGIRGTLVSTHDVQAQTLRAFAVVCGQRADGVPADSAGAAGEDCGCWLHLCLFGVCGARSLQGCLGHVSCSS